MSLTDVTADTSTGSGEGTIAMMHWQAVSTILMAFVGALALTGATAHRQPSYAVMGSRSAVLVELFTSEGCSSCPPADATLAWLKNIQPVSGAEVIALSEHVDYWNGGGWADPFSSAKFSSRQNDYADSFKLDSVYTPQMVVNGRKEFVGSDREKAQSEIKSAARQAKADVKIAAENVRNGNVAVKTSVDGLAKFGEADAFIAITEDDLHSHVARGEIAGRHLTHVAVVRRLEKIGATKPVMAFEATTRVALSPKWRQDRLEAIAFIQERASRHILGAGAVAVH